MRPDPGIILVEDSRPGPSIWVEARERLEDARAWGVRWQDPKGTAIVRGLVKDYLRTQWLGRPYGPNRGMKKPRGPKNKSRQRRISGGFDRAVRDMMGFWEKYSPEIMSAP